MHNFMQPNRHILACGILGGAFPNTMSNIHPYLTGALVAGLLSK